MRATAAKSSKHDLGHGREQQHSPAEPPPPEAWGVRGIPVQVYACPWNTYTTHNQIPYPDSFCFFNRVDEMGGRIIYASSPVQQDDEDWLEYRQFQFLGSWTSRSWRWLFSKDGAKQSAEPPGTDEKVDSSPGRSNSSSGGGAHPRVRYIYDTCIAVDCSQWLDAMASCTKARYPDVDIRVVQSASSLTGFCIVFRLPPPSADGYEYVTWRSSNEGETDDPAADDDALCATPFFSLACLNKWQQRCFKRVSDVFKWSFRFICFMPLHLYLKASRQKSHLMGMLILYGMLHGTYILVKHMHGTPLFLQFSSEAGNQ